MMAILLSCVLGTAPWNFSEQAWIGTYRSPSGQTFVQAFPISRGGCPPSITFGL